MGNSQNSNPNRKSSDKNQEISREKMNGKYGMVTKSVADDKKGEIPKVVDAVIVDGQQSGWTRDELYSSQWLFAMAKKHDLVDEASMKILMENEFDAFLVRKYGDEKLKELGVSDQSRENLMKFVSSL